MNYHDFLKFWGLGNFEGVEVNYHDFLKFWRLGNFEGEVKFQGLVNMHGIDVLNAYGPEDFMNVMVQERGTGVTSVPRPLIRSDRGVDETPLATCTFRIWRISRTVGVRSP